MKKLIMIVLVSLFVIPIQSQNCNITAGSVTDLRSYPPHVVYAVCVSMEGNNLPAEFTEFAFVQVNGVNVEVGSYQVNEQRTLSTVCAVNIPTECFGSINDVFIQLEEGCNIDLPALYSTPDVGQEPCPPIPTLSQWGIILLGMLAMIFGIAAMKYSGRFRFQDR